MAPDDALEMGRESPTVTVSSGSMPNRLRKLLKHLRCPTGSRLATEVDVLGQGRPGMAQLVGGASSRKAGFSAGAHQHAGEGHLTSRSSPLFAGRAGPRLRCTVPPRRSPR